MTRRSGGEPEHTGGEPFEEPARTLVPVIHALHTRVTSLPSPRPHPRSCIHIRRDTTGVTRYGPRPHAWGERGGRGREGEVNKPR